jgi:hypothetical protein
MLINKANVPANIIFVHHLLLLLFILFVMLFNFPKRVKIYVFVMETQCDFCEARAELINITLIRYVTP